MIEGKERTIDSVFDTKRRYRIPDYQRPYAWGEDHAERLFEDLCEAFSESAADYFLGSLVLVKTSETDFEVVDGQQRLCTLAILLSTLIHSLPPDEKGSYEALLNDKASRRADSPLAPRITAQENDRDSLDLVQTFKLDELPRADNGNRIARNARLIQTLAEERFSGSDETLDFIDFIIENCYVVEVVSDNLENAFRMFSVLNSRGLDLSPVDLVKPRLFRDFTEKERSIYNRRWNDADAAIGPDGMNSVLAHVRFMLIPSKGRRAIYEEVSSLIGPRMTSREFIDTWFLPAVDSYAVVKNTDYPGVENPEPINTSLKWLNKIENSDWMPVAMLFLMKNPDEEQALEFFPRLERLAACLQATGANVNARIERYGKIIEELHAIHGANAVPASLELTAEEKAKFLQVLNSDIYLLPSYRRKYLLMRLCEAVSDGVANYSAHQGIVTVEHVLPQTMASDSNWAQQWTSEEHEQWLHKLANLVLLTRRVNSAAQNYEFDRKKREYFTSKYGTSSFALTTQVLNESEWTPTVVERRQEGLIATLKDKWDLGE